MKRRMEDGPALPLAKFAEAKASGYDKRARIEKQRKQHLNKVGKYKKLLHRMEAQGKPLTGPSAVKDNVAELEQLFFSGDAAKETTQNDSRQPKKKRKHEAAQDEAPSSQPEAPHSEQQQQGLGKKPKRQPQEQNEPKQPLEEPASIEPHGSKQRSQAREGQQPFKGKPRQQNTQPGSEAGEGSKHGHKHVKPGQKPSRLHRLLSEQDQRQAEAAEAKRKAQESRAQRQAQVEAVQKQRRKDKQQFFKRTRTGQPLMRYRMEKILSALQKE